MLQQIAVRFQREQAVGNLVEVICLCIQGTQAEFKEPVQVHT